jgi:hypothetical protein
MKNLKLFILLFLIGITACKKDESKIEAKVAIIGKWQLKSIEETRFKNGVKTDENKRSQENSIELKNDGKAIFDKRDYTYQVEGNKRLVLTAIGETKPEYDFEIKNITEGELVLNIEFSSTEKNGDVFIEAYLLSFTK